MKRRVVITGLGVVSSVGNDLEQFWNSLKNGVSGIKKVTKFNTEGFKVRIGGEVRDFEPEKYFDKKWINRTEPYIHYAGAAALDAVKLSGLDLNSVIPERMGVLVGSGIGGIRIIEEQVKLMNERGPDRISPFLITKMITDIVPGRLAMLFNAKGPNFSISTACATGTHSIGEAFRVIQRGDADLMLCGGTESSITPLAYAGFGAIKAISASHNESPEKASRPFDKDRDGFVIAEGAGILLLETLENAEKRGANILGELVGYGNTADAYHETAPHPEGEGAFRSIICALEDAEVAKEEVSYINAHGTSTELNDIMETKAIKKAFGELAYKIPVSSTKSMHGHVLGATGAIEAIACIMAMKDNIIPPTINLDEPDPECDLNYVPNKAIKTEVNTVLTNSFGFGGHNATLIFKRFNG
ncbi:MAG TPA: beta-ketoacyl-[acyl-carrier-protein] synthase II [Firmicutes bacterium]|nr:beta-ketoacyl-[acyl-carrier-protein] synthase II [Bacillota bacterium]